MIKLSVFSLFNYKMIEKINVYSNKFERKLLYWQCKNALKKIPNFK